MNNVGHSLIPPPPRPAHRPRRQVPGRAGNDSPLLPGGQAGARAGQASPRDLQGLPGAGENAGEFPLWRRNGQSCRRRGRGSVHSRHGGAGGERAREHQWLHRSSRGSRVDEAPLLISLVACMLSVSVKLILLRLTDGLLCFSLGHHVHPKIREIHLCLVVCVWRKGRRRLSQCSGWDCSG